MVCPGPLPFSRNCLVLDYPGHVLGDDLKPDIERYFKSNCVKPENREFLERFRHHYEHYTKDRTIPRHLHIDLQDKRRMLEVAREEFDPNYSACITCSEDFMTLFNYLFVQMGKQVAPVAKVEAGNDPANRTRNYKRKTRK